MPVKKFQTEEVDAIMQVEDETGDVQPGDVQDGVDASDMPAEGGNDGWADVMNRLLTAPAPSKKYVILSKSKKARPSDGEAEKVQESGPGFEVDGEEAEVVEENTAKSRAARPRAVRRKEEMERRRKHKEWESMGRVKPDVRDKDRERTLCKIATRGVVQLFNAVQKQQAETEARLAAAGGSVRKTEQALSAVSKRAFLERLEAGADAAGEVPVQECDKSATWSVLRDDYLPEVGLKDWDRESDQQDSGSADESSDGA